MEKLLLLAGCTIFVLLGAVHLIYTLFTDKFQPRDAGLMADMQRVNPVLTRRTTMWNAWIGFNASHSVGAIFFGVVYITIASENYGYLRASIALNILLLAVSLAYLVLAVKYWFSVPRNGIMLATILIVLSMALRMTP
jgi:hypothetical protein